MHSHGWAPWPQTNPHPDCTSVSARFAFSVAQSSKDIRCSQLQPLRPALCWTISKLCYQSSHSPARSLSSSHFIDGEGEGLCIPREESHRAGIQTQYCPLLPSPPHGFASVFPRDTCHLRQDHPPVYLRYRTSSSSL